MNRLGQHDPGPHRPTAGYNVGSACFWALLLCVSALPAPAAGQGIGDTAREPSPATTVTAPSFEENPASVVIDGRTILTIHSAIAGFTAHDRAELIQEHILNFAKTTTPVESIHVEDRGAWSEVLAGEELILTVAETDARAVSRSRQNLAAEDAEIIRRVVRRYREEHTWRNFFRGLLYSAIATVAFLGLLVLQWRISRVARQKAEAWISHREELIPAASKARLSLIYLARPLLTLGRLIRWVVVIVLLEIYVGVLLHFFPQTEQISLNTTNWLFSQMSGLGEAALGYIPNLFLVIVICSVAYYILRASSLIFGEIEAGRLQISGFYPDWARPTSSLVRVLIVALTAVVVFPYLPGSKSPAFQGISIFLGVLLSLGSSSAVANAVAGTILNYTRSFQVGDVVMIGDVFGEVLEKSLLVTRIRTPKKEVVSIPNGTVMSGAVKNYSTQAKITGVVLHTTVTIGYDAPWRTVHQLLINAALATQYVMKVPEPFVWQKALNDFYVAYEINAYTDAPNRMMSIYSELHQNIQDKFNEGGIEINSPHYTALRDGNATTIPEGYLPQSYEAPAFHVRRMKAEPADSAAAGHQE